MFYKIAEPILKLVPSRRIELLSIGYQPIALPLSYEGINLVATAGLEPATQGFSILCSTIGAMQPNNLGSCTRIELVMTESQPVVLPLN